MVNKDLINYFFAASYERIVSSLLFILVGIIPKVKQVLEKLIAKKNEPFGPEGNNGSIEVLSEEKKWQTDIAPLQPPTLATFRSWGSSAGAGRADSPVQRYN